MHWSRYNRLAERFEHQSNVWTIATMRRLGVFLPRLRRRLACPGPVSNRLAKRYEHHSNVWIAMMRRLGMVLTGRA